MKGSSAEPALFGHQAGNELLVSVSHRVRGLLGDDQLLARLAGDEFVVLCRGIDAEMDARRLAGLIAVRLAEPFALSAGVAEIGASVGVATHDGIEDLQHLLHRADTAMYAEKAITASR
ncbi:GGDEF domain-containing protein [Micromonosporaceae bacterium Da 78-11]